MLDSILPKIPRRPATRGRAVLFFAAILFAFAGCGRYVPGTLPALTGVTEDAPWDGDVAISHDGKNVAFVSERGDGARGLFVRKLPQGEPRTLVSGPGNVSRPSWSRDGRRILFTREVERTAQAFVVDAAGGDVRPLGVSRTNASEVRDAVFSPDDERVACVLRGDSTWMLAEVRLADFMVTTLVTSLPAFPPSRPAYSPDGKGIAYVWQDDLWWVSVAGGPPVRLTAGAARESDPTFSPNGKWLAFASDSTGYANLWLARVERKGKGDAKVPSLAAWRPVTAAFQQGRRPAFDPRGRTLWFDRQDPWVVAARDLEGGAVATLSSSLFDDRAPSWSGDGYQIVFVSTRGGGDDLWVMESRGEAASGPAKQVTRDPATDTSPSWSRASGQVAFVSNRDGFRNLYLTDASGEDLGALTEGPGERMDPRWSPDGRSIAFAVDPGWGPELVVLDGVARIRRTVRSAAGSRAPDWMPDGTALVYAAPSEGRRSLFRTAFYGPAPIALTNDEVEGSWDDHPSVSPDGGQVLFTRVRRGDADLWLLDLSTGQARPVVENPRSMDDCADWSPDGRRFAFQTGGAVNLVRADVGPLLLP